MSYIYNVYPPYFFKIHIIIIIILLRKSVSPKCFLPSRISIKILYAFIIPSAQVEFGVP